MTDLQASIGVAQLARLEAFGRRAATISTSSVGRSRRSRSSSSFRGDAGHRPSWFGFLLTVRESAPFTRGEVVRALEAKKVQTRMLFGGNLTRQPALTELVRRAPSAGLCPIAWPASSGTPTPS
jgi:CDP-6-deoxy-D-xylo-4-hexulose-3-dehydrase